VPKFGHMPMILGTDKKRLSKRHGAASVEEFRDGHWLSEALVNYLALLGWSPGNDQEFFTVGQIIKKFSLKRLNNTAAVFDYEKARHLNGEHMKAFDLQKKIDTAWSILTEAGVVSDDSEKERLARVLSFLGNRFSHFDRTLLHLSSYFTDEYPVDPEVAAGIDEAVRARLDALADSYAALGTFDAGTAEQALRGLAEATGEKAGLFIHPARFAISGSGSGPSLFDAMALLGQDRVVRRLRDPRTG
jgi:glutamyl/glutaminyl-tRNA synthetase